jgi:DNA processing protein
MDDTITRMAFLSDVSGHSVKMGRLLLETSLDSDLDETIDWLFKELQISSLKGIDRYHSELERLKNSNVTIMHFFGDSYPRQLRSIDDPPILLYLKGNYLDFSDCIAISGSRNPSHLGHRAARDIAGFFAEKGSTIVAGFARGIDLEAHIGALDAAGHTFAVLPSSISDIYPKENARLAEDIVHKGLLISEMSPFEKMNRLSFIRRNRITTGLSRCLVLGESDGTGGTLQQFNIAKKQERPVFALRPHDRDRHAMRGFERFVKGGAIPISDGKEVLDHLAKKVVGQSTLVGY